MSTRVSPAAMVLDVMADLSVRKATYFHNPNLTIKASRHDRVNRNSRIDSIVLTYGKPNYKEREFIKLCKKAGEKFPVKKIQIKYWPKEKK